MKVVPFKPIQSSHAEETVRILEEALAHALKYGCHGVCITMINPDGSLEHWLGETDQGVVRAGATAILHHRAVTALETIDKS